MCTDAVNAACRATSRSASSKGSVRCRYRVSSPSTVSRAVSGTTSMECTPALISGAKPSGSVASHGSSAETRTRRARRSLRTCVYGVGKGSGRLSPSFLLTSAVGGAKDTRRSGTSVGGGPAGRSAAATPSSSRSTVAASAKAGTSAPTSSRAVVSACSVVPTAACTSLSTASRSAAACRSVTSSTTPTRPGPPSPRSRRGKRDTSTARVRCGSDGDLPRTSRPRNGSPVARTSSIRPRSSAASNPGAKSSMPCPTTSSADSPRTPRPAGL